MFQMFRIAQRAAVLAAFWPVLALPVLASVTVTKTADLAFGKLVPGSSVGSVAMSPAGSRSRTGDVTLFSQGGGTGNAASFLVTVSEGIGFSTCSVILPGNDFIYLTSAGARMVLNSFTPLPASITLDGNGTASATIHVGGTLTVGGAQVSGLYLSNFSVSVTCP